MFGDIWRQGVSIHVYGDVSVGDKHEWRKKKDSYFSRKVYPYKFMGM